MRQAACADGKAMAIFRSEGERTSIQRQTVKPPAPWISGKDMIILELTALELQLPSFGAGNNAAFVLFLHAATGFLASMDRHELFQVSMLKPSWTDHP